MKLLDILKNVKKREEDSQNKWISLDVFNSYGFEYWNVNMENNEYLRIYPIKTWICTDTEVGVFVLYFKEEPVAIIKQNARKSPETISFLDKSCKSIVLEYLKSLTVPDETDIEDLDIISEEELQEDIPLTYSVEYSSQIFQKTCIYGTKEVPIIKCYHNYEDWKFLDIEVDGVVKKVNLKDIKLKLEVEIK